MTKGIKTIKHIHIISPWKRYGPSFEQTLISFSEGCFVPRLVKISLFILEKKILKLYRYIFAISLSSPLEKELALYLNKLETSFVPSVVEIGLLVLEKKFFF